METTEERIRFITFIWEHWEIIGAIVVLFLSVMFWSILKWIELGKEEKRLSFLNNSLLALNRKYQSVNAKLKEENRRLFEANLKRNKYFLRLGRLYCNRIDDCEANRQTVREWYAVFDSAVTELFPEFVEKFNSLLKEGEGYEWKKGEPLPPELRVFALLRLGVKKDAETAQFLHCSPEKIRTYREEVEKKSASGKDIEWQVLELCKESSWADV